MNEAPIEVLVIALIICFVFSAFFSSSETALISINKYSLKSAVKKNVRGSHSAEIITKHLDLLLILLLVFNNIVNVLAAAIATLIGLRLYGDLGVAIATGALTILLMFFAEIIPKTIANNYNEKVSYLFAPILRLMMFLFRPVILLINAITRVTIRMLGITNRGNNKSLSNDELKIIFSEMSDTTSRNDNNRMMSSILELEQLNVAMVMTPENEIYSFDINDDFKNIMKIINNSPHSIIVAYRDNFEKIVGTLRVSAAYRSLFESEIQDKDVLLRSLDEANFIPETTSLAKQLVFFKNSKEKVSLVLDEYGRVTGLISMDDIFKEIVGEFSHQDYLEYVQNITGSYEIEGSTLLRDLNKQFNWKFDNSKARTINGYILEITKEIPREGETIETELFNFKIISTSKTKINNVEVKPKFS